MDRTKLKLLGILIVLGLPQWAWAGTVLVNSGSFSAIEENAPDGTAYPQSRFGSPPAKPDLGVTPGYASRAADDMDRDGDDGVAPSRSPAGLVFGNNPVAQSGRMPAPSPRTQSTQAPADTKSVAGVQEVALIASDLGFFPKTVFVSRDVPVRLFVTGSSKNTLCIMMDSFQVRKQVRAQKIEEINFTPNMPGQYRFYCPVNGAEGALIVKELSSSLSVSPAAPAEPVGSSRGVQQAFNHGSN